MKIKISSKQWNNLGFKRKAQEDWYNVVIAIDTEDDEILTKILRQGKDDMVSWYAAENSYCPPEALAEVLKREENDSVSRVAVSNPNCPPEALAEVLKRGNNDLVSRYAASNPNCPSEALAEVLRRGNDDGVSRHAARNPNCPLKEKFEWLEATGQLTKYDPEKFELEHDEEDKDLEELRKLMGNNGNWYRKAQEEDWHWYNLATAIETEDPVILAKILRQGKDDMVSEYAAGNPNCPPEILAEVLRRGKDDWVSRSVADNPNCPPEALDEVLRRGNNDHVSYHAVKNLSCSPWSLAAVLKRGNNDIVSWWAIRNPNCPPKAKLEWYEATGKLTKYDPEKFELEHDEEDKDLEELRKLMGKKNFNLHRKSQKKEEDYLGSYHSWELARGTNCSEFLAKVLKREKNDLTSFFAAGNPNCPPEVLAEVLRRGKNDRVSWAAAQNPSCPPEVLAEILRRGKDDAVSEFASKNPSCPPDALEEILKRKENDYISLGAALNPNCSPKARIDWLEATGKLTKYDPKIHELEKVEEDKDLEELRKLMGKGRNNMKISKKVNNEYSWVFINLPDEAKKAVLSFGKEIDEDDLYVKEADNGLETDPHVTVKYALLTNDFKDVKEVIGKHKKGNLFLGKSSVFECEDYDVVKMTVESDVLRDLHEKLNGLPHKDKHFEYNPHATIAYVKKGKGTKYDGKFEINKKFKFDDVRWQICHNEGSGKKIKLAFNLYRWNIISKENREM